MKNIAYISSKTLLVIVIESINTRRKIPKAKHFQLGIESKNMIQGRHIMMILLNSVLCVMYIHFCKNCIVGTMGRFYFLCQLCKIFV